MFQRQIGSLISIGLYLATMAQAAPRVLVYTATDGYRHDSIPTAIEVLGQQGPNYNVSFDFTEDRSRFTQDNLANYDGIMFVSTSEEGTSPAYVSVSAVVDAVCTRSSGRHRQIGFPRLATERRRLHRSPQRKRLLVQYTVLQRDRWGLVRLPPRFAVRRECLVNLSLAVLRLISLSDFPSREQKPSRDHPPPGSMDLRTSWHFPTSISR